MPRVCSICSHPSRHAIDAAIVGGQILTRIAALYRVSTDAIERHARAHIPPALAKAQQADEVGAADALLRQVKDLTERAWRILDGAESVGDFRTALLAIREARSCLELLARLVGELDESPQINLIISPEWATTRAALLEALGPYPEARADVAARLMTLEGAGGHARR